MGNISISHGYPQHTYHDISDRNLLVVTEVMTS